MTKTALTYVKLGFILMYLNITIGRFDLLPDFLGVVFLLIALHKQTMTETERRLRPLLALLAADYFLHWLFAYENNLENLIMTAISIYTVYVLLGEIAGRISSGQPDQARLLNRIRKALTLLQIPGYILAAYDMQGVMTALSLLCVGLLIALLWVLFHIVPTTEDN